MEPDESSQISTARQGKCRKVSKDVAKVANVADEDEDETVNKDKPYRAAKRVPVKWSASQEGLDYAEAQGMSPQEWFDELGSFRDHEFKAARKDWDAAWLTVKSAALTDEATRKDLQAQIA